MSKIDELQRRIEHLETEVDLLKELVKLQNKIPEMNAPVYPSAPLQPYYAEEPTPRPPYKTTCDGR